MIYNLNYIIKKKGGKKTLNSEEEITSGEGGIPQTRR